jgi:hypothetical protein
MRRMVHSQFVIWMISILTAYWSVGLLTPFPDYFNGAVSGFLLVFSGLVFAQWGVDAFRLVLDAVRGRRQITRGDELSLVGVALLATGAFYQATFALAWVIAGQAASWLNTPFSAFGRFTMAIGFMLMFVSPLKAPAGKAERLSWWSLGPIFLLLVAFGFVLGSQWAQLPREKGISLATVTETAAQR